MLAKRTETLFTSPTVALDMKAKKLKASGIPIINLSAGEPDFDTPVHIKKATQQLLNTMLIKYDSPQGIVEFRTAIANKFKKDNNINYEPTQIVVGIGVKQLLYTVLQVICDYGDEVVVPVPTYNSFVEQIKLAGGKPIFIKLQPPFKLTAKAIEKVLTKKTKIIILNSPANPTGAMIDTSELQKIADLAVTKNLWVISDEIYEKLVYTGKHISIASLNEHIKERTITINGVSKSYAMTGWRLGFAGGPINVIKTVTALQSQTIGNVPTFIQQAGISALTGKQTSVQTMQKEFAKRRTYLMKELANIQNLSYATPEGAFYFFIAIEKLLGEKYKNATEWCNALLEKENVAVAPGEAFYAPGYFRLSFTASIEELKETIARIKSFIS